MVIHTATEARQCEDLLSTVTTVYVRSSHTFNAAWMCGKFVLIMSVAGDLHLGAFLATSLDTTKAIAFIVNPGARQKERERFSSLNCRVAAAT